MGGARKRSSAEAKKGRPELSQPRKIMLTTLPPTTGNVRVRFFNGSTMGRTIIAYGRPTVGSTTGQEVQIVANVNADDAAHGLSDTTDYKQFLISINGAQKLFQVSDGAGGYWMLGAIDIERWSDNHYSVGLSYSQDAAMPYRPKYRTAYNYATWE